MANITSTSSITEVVGQPPNLYVPPATSQLSVSAALRYLRLTPGASTITINDSNVNIQKNLAALQALQSRITEVTSTDAVKLLTVTDKDYTNDKGILSKWVGNSSEYKLNFTDISSAKAKTIWDSEISANVNSFAVKDTAINIQNNFTDLTTMATNGVLGSVLQLNTSALITLSVDQYQSGATLLTKINKGFYNLAVTGASVGNVITAAGGLNLGANTRVKSISITDNTDNIDDNIDALQRLGMKIKTIAQTDANPSDLVLELNASQIQTNAFVLGKIVTGYQLAAQNTSAAQFSNILNNKKVITVDIVDKAANISRNWNTLNNLNNGTLSTVTVSDGTSTPIKINASQMAVSKTLLNKFSQPLNGSPTFKIEVTEATASQVSDMLDTKEISSFDIKDTSENIGLYLNSLIDAVDTLKINSIKTPNTAVLEMSYSTYNTADTATLLQKINKGAYSLKITDVSVEQVDLLRNNKSIDSFSVVDTVDTIQSISNLDKLTSLGSRLKSIDLVDADIGKSLTMSGSTYLNRKSVLNKIVGGYSVDLQAVTAKQAVAFSSDIRVNKIDIEDNAKNIASYWNSLVSVNDQIDEIFTGSQISIAISADQFQLGDAVDLQNKFKDSDVKFAIKNATIDQASDLLKADESENFIRNIEIRDNSANIGSHLDDLKAMVTDGFLTKIFHTTNREPISLSYTDMTTYDSVLAKIEGQGYKLSVTNVAASDAKALSVTNDFRNVAWINVKDSSTNISDKFSELVSIGSKLSSLNLTDPDGELEINYGQYIKGRGTLDKIQDSYYLNITDAPVYNASALASNGHVKEMSLTGSGSVISQAWDTLSSLGEKITSVLKVGQDAVGLKFSQWLSYADLRDKLLSVSPSVDFTVSDASVSNFSDLNTDANVKEIQIVDTSDVLDDAASIPALSSTKVKEIVLQDDAVPLSLSADYLTENILVLNKIKDNKYLLNVLDATADQTLDLVANTSSSANLPLYANVKTINLTDSSDQITNNFEALKIIDKIQSVVLPTADEALKISATTMINGSALLGKIQSYELNIIDTSMLQLSTVAESEHVKSVEIKDTSARVSADFDKLIALGPNLADLNFISIDGVSNALDITYEQWTASKETLKLLPSVPYDFNLSEVMASQATSAAINENVLSIQVTDTAENINLDWDNLQTLYGSAELPGKLTNLTFTDFGPLNLTAQQLLSSNLLNEVTVSNPVTVKDSAANISANWNSLVTQFGTGTGKFRAVEMTDPTSKVLLTTAQQNAGSYLIRELPLEQESVQVIA